MEHATRNWRSRWFGCAFVSALLGAAPLLAGSPGALATASADGAVSVPSDIAVVTVEKTSTRVGIALVRLEIGELVIDADEGTMTGRYEIRVPLKSSKNEGGDLLLFLSTDIATLMEEGGEIRGIGESDKENMPTRRIEATVLPSTAKEDRGKIRMTVDVGERVLHFDTRFHLLTPPDGTFALHDEPSGAIHADRD